VTLDRLLLHGSLSPCESSPKPTSDRFSSFCTAHPCAQHTDYSLRDVGGSWPHLPVKPRAQCGLKCEILTCLLALFQQRLLSSWALTNFRTMPGSPGKGGKLNSEKDWEMRRKLFQKCPWALHSMEIVKWGYKTAWNAPASRHSHYFNNFRFTLHRLLQRYAWRLKVWGRVNGQVLEIIEEILRIGLHYYPAMRLATVVIHKLPKRVNRGSRCSHQGVPSTYTECVIVHLTVDKLLMFVAAQHVWPRLSGYETAAVRPSRATLSPLITT